MCQMEVQRHNQTVLSNLEEGDLIEFNRGLYSHWAVYVGEGKVVHLAGDANDGLSANFNSGSIFTICGQRFNKAFVKIDDFWDVALDSKAIKNNQKDGKMPPKSKREIVDDAIAKMGAIGYNVLWSNCEHFASFCRYGVEKSDQASNFFTWAWAIVGVAAGLVTTYVFGKPRTNQNKS